jgi:uncharacterized DUF497 family protein
MSEGTVYEFLWDPAKAQLNARKHDVTFDQAATVFLDVLALTVYDESNSQDEERWFTLGFHASGKLLAVAHTYELTGLSLQGRPVLGYALSRPARRPDASDLLTKRNPDR